MVNFFLYIFTILFISCEDNNKGPRIYKIYKNDSSSPIIEDSNIEKSIDFIWDAPTSWIVKENTSSFRLASYDVPYINSIADLSITKFPGDAGGVKANVNRWRKQLNLSALSMEELNSNAYNGNSKLGSFLIYKIINKENIESAFLCMILNLKDSTIFIKLNASVEGINILENEFNEFCSSLRPI